MPAIDLKYGRSKIKLDFDDAAFEVLGRNEQRPALQDAEIGEILENPIGSPRLEEIVNAGETVLLVVPDATRQTASGQIVNLLVRRLIANGSKPHEINIIFATGIHRRVTESEKEEILTPFIAQRIKTLHHDARSPLKNFKVGETSGGITVELNWQLTEFDHVILVGGVTFHYFAGFTGGRKLICPGLASATTIAATHKLAFDCETRSRTMGVGPGLLDGNPVNDAFTEAAALIKPSFALFTIVNDDGDAVDLFCGDWKQSHRAACDAYAREHIIEIAEKRSMVVASCGGFPYDINLIQAHKSVDAAARACSDGGTIVLLAECPDGLGRDDFLEWFEAPSSRELAERLCEAYQVNGQTAWSLLEKTERFRVLIMTELPAESMRSMRMEKLNGVAEVNSLMSHHSSGFFLPFGAKFLPREM